MPVLVEARAVLNQTPAARHMKHAQQHRIRPANPAPPRHIHSIVVSGRILGGLRRPQLQFWQHDGTQRARLNRRYSAVPVTDVAIPRIDPEAFRDFSFRRLQERVKHNSERTRRPFSSLPPCQVDISRQRRCHRAT